MLRHQCHHPDHPGNQHDGQWSEYFYCKPWSYSTRVEFRVRDANGVYSETWVSTCGNGDIEL